jgi:tetratricopeptide (TPR) repeat protein
MMLNWFNSREAAQVGTALADEFAPRITPNAAHNKGVTHRKGINAIQELLRHADRTTRALRLNFYKKAKFANSFKWRLIENGVDSDVANQVTQALVLHLSQNQAVSEPGHESSGAPPPPADTKKAKNLLVQGDKCFERGAYGDAMALYAESMELDLSQPEVFNSLGAALCGLGRYVEAEQRFRQAIERAPDYPEAHCNLGNVLRWQGDMAAAEVSLRRALKLRPNYADARTGLGLILVFLGRLRDARARFEKVLKTAPRHVDALFGMGQIARLEGRFGDADATFRRVLELKPRAPGAWAVLSSLRKMTAADADWLKGAEEIASSGIPSLDESGLRFAIGKYYDDVNDFANAFQNYKRANELLRTVAENYDRRARTRFVDDMIGGHTGKAMPNVGEGGSASRIPVFIVGMMRSGTSLAEQIIASHPAAIGAGELKFWSEAAGAHAGDLRRGVLSEPTRKNLADAYLRVLAGHSAHAQRIVDKAPVNSDCLGMIHSVFPNARIIYMQRDPIDTCLSCYFQQFSVLLNYTMDLSDLAHYHREHQRLMKHWRAVLPPGSILEVPYEGLVTNQEAWTRKILEFVGLEWDERCLEFHKTKRSVATASSWQVRQKIYNNSVGRWQNYEEFVGPLKGLRV